jgi:ABC transporter substrate binding protein (PQQ-dependent alcohol dehydrogenase system)
LAAREPRRIIVDKVRRVSMEGRLGDQLHKAKLLQRTAFLLAMTIIVAGALGRGARADDAATAPAPHAPQSPTPETAAKIDTVTIHIAYLAKRIAKKLPYSFLDLPPQDDGVAGARIGTADDNTTGRFTGQSFVLDEVLLSEKDDVAAAFRKLVQEGHRLVILDLPAADLLAIADLPEAKPTILLNVAAADDRLRAEDCRSNVLHLTPSRAMLTDALVQYLVLKRWRNVLLAPGPSDGDKEYTAAMKRSLKKFGAKLVAEKPWTFEPGARRTDTGHFQIAAEVGRFTQGISYDVLVVADEDGDFGTQLPYRTTDPRPVAGTQGLTPTSWARPFEQWGATQLQNRFRRQASRWMGERDYAAWMAVRAIGEAATRARSGDGDAIIRYMRSPDFELAAFKGVKLGFRPWDGQLRQPILLADADSLVSVSPQPGFLHEVSELDTLGIDRPETRCKMTR